MRLEAVTVCVNYAGELAVAAPFNAPSFDRWIIVTDPDDWPTRKVCRHHHLTCITSTEHARNGDAFNKGRMIERGLQHLSKDCFRLHIDADIVLPRRTRTLLDWAHLDEANVYGCDRIMCYGQADWERLLATGYLDWTNDRSPHSVLFPPGFQIGDRWARPQEGYVPIGFFQLWHGSADEQAGYRVRPYPSHHGDACRGDVQHGLQWDRRQRVLLPELIAVHLATSKQNGINWKGRESPPWGQGNEHAPGEKLQAAMTGGPEVVGAAGGPS